MSETFDLEIQISAGKKSFTVVCESSTYTLIESGSIAAVLKKKDGNWEFTSGSYSLEDAKLVGEKIEQIER